MTGQFKRVAALLEPLDVLFFRDARPFGLSSRGSSGLPLPQTLVGAVRTALGQVIGCDFERIHESFRCEINQPRLSIRERQACWRKVARQSGVPKWFFGIQVRGPWLTRVRNGDRAPSEHSSPSKWELLFPAPATIYSFKKSQNRPSEIWVARPLRKEQKLPGWKAPREGMRPIWVPTREDIEPWSGFITAGGMQKFLQNEKPDQVDLVRADELFGYDDRTGIAVSPDRLTSEESYIYAADFLALRNNVAFYMEVKLPAEEETTWKSVSFLRWGGEGRHVAVKHLDTPIELPHVVPQKDQKPLLVLTTPGLFEAGWYPQRFQDYLVAAAMPGEVALSGWDLSQRGPKPTRFAAAAGSVYFLDGLPEKLTEWLSDHKPLSDKPQDRQQGWGCFLQGVWNDD